MSSIIKSSHVHLVANNVVQDKLEKQLEQQNEILNNAEKQYQEIIDIAKKQAKDIVNDATQEVSKMREMVLEEAKKEAENIKKQKSEEGYSQGYTAGYELGNTEGNSKGYQDGFNEGRDEAEKLIEEANQIKREYLQEREETLNSIETDVINLVLHICEKILNKSLEENEETIVDLVLKGIESLNNKDSVIIRVSKQDFDILEQSKQKILSKASLIENLDVKLDSNLQKGDCVIESSKGSVDVSINVQINEMKQMIKDLLDSE